MKHTAKKEKQATQHIVLGKIGFPHHLLSSDWMLTQYRVQHIFRKWLSKLWQWISSVIGLLSWQAETRLQEWQGTMKKSFVSCIAKVPRCAWHATLPSLPWKKGLRHPSSLHLQLHRGRVCHPKAPGQFRRFFSAWNANWRIGSLCGYASARLL